jgi:aspartate/methionine/tyrosine aminotransferase
LRIQSQVLQLGTESAFTVLARARQLEATGRRVLHLELGEPDFPTPPHIVEAAMRGLRQGCTRYGPAPGLPELREAIADSLRARQLSVGREQILVTSGSKPMLFYALMALLGPGNEALVPDPGFPIYESVVRFAEATPVRYSVDPGRRFPVDHEEMAELVTSRTRVIVLNSPHNPTGAVLDVRTLARIAELALQHDLVVVSDEIYSQLLFDGWHTSIASLPGMASRTIVVDGFSKAYAMTGWRLGFGVVPRKLVSAVERLIVNTTSCVPAFVQLAGLAALEGSQDCVRQMARELQVMRDEFVAGLNQLADYSCPLPRGAFYAFPRVSGLLSRLELTTEALAGMLLEEFGLACLPGTSFGPGGIEHLRFSFANSRPALGQALALLRQASPSQIKPGLRHPGGSDRGVVLP